MYSLPHSIKTRS